jgi:hypothetical protein
MDLTLRREDGSHAKTRRRISRQGAKKDLTPRRKEGSHAKTQRRKGKSFLVRKRVTRLLAVGGSKNLGVFASWREVLLIASWRAFQFVTFARASRAIFLRAVVEINDLVPEDPLR